MKKFIVFKALTKAREREGGSGPRRIARIQNAPRSRETEKTEREQTRPRQSWEKTAAGIELVFSSVPAALLVCLSY